MAEQQEPRRELDEKEEKDRRETQEKQEKEEKDRGQSWEEKWRNDPLSAASWAAILIWAGIALLLENMGLLRGLEELDAGNLIFIGAGLIVWGAAAVRLLVPAYRRPVVGSLIFGLILIAIGSGDLIKWGALWPLILIIIGVGLLARGLMRRR
jgi:hypothetical protein